MEIPFAWQDTRLNEILNAEGTYTVLAPPDVAFYQMPEEVLSEITKDARKAANILKQHILPGKHSPLCSLVYLLNLFIFNS